MNPDEIINKNRLGIVKWLFDRQTEWKVMMLTTANWLEISRAPIGRILALPLEKNKLVK